MVVGYIQNQQKKQSRGIFLLFYFLYKNKTEVPIRMIHECTSHCTKYLVQINNGPACIFLRNSCTLYAVILLLHIQYSHFIGLLYLHSLSNNLCSLHAMLILRRFVWTECFTQCDIDKLTFYQCFYSMYFYLGKSQ